MEQRAVAVSTGAIDPTHAARAHWVDVLRLIFTGVAYAFAAALRRIVGYKRRPGWTVSLEAWIAASRGVWSVMPTIGVVRWRNATETVSPLKTNGLMPRFVREEGDHPVLQGAWLEPPGADRRVVLYLLANAEMRPRPNV